jgi:hypothetical protein
VSLLFLLLISQLLFFSLVGGRSVQGDMLLWPRFVSGSTTVLQSSPCPRLLKPSGHEQLVAQGPSLFLCLTWRFSALAGAVQGSKFCLFSVTLPAKCVSSVSPRFHYRRLTFHFLPLATILESLPLFLDLN